MTARRRLRPGDIAVGVTTPCDLYDASGKLLLPAGSVLADEQQWQQQVAQGLYMNLDMMRRLEPTSVRQCVLHAIDRLETVYRDPQSAAPIPAHLMYVARMVQAAWARSHSVMLATVMLYRDPVTPACHAVHTACFTQTVMNSMGIDERMRPSILAAAMTMHLPAQALAQAHDRPLVASIAGHEVGVRQYLQALGVSDTLWLDLVDKAHEATTIQYRQRAPDATTIAAQLIALADLYASRILDPDGKHFGNSRIVLRELLTERGQHFDALLASHFIRALGIYPVGSVVSLRSGEIGVVCESSDQVDAPWVCSLIGPLGSVLQEAKIRDTREALHGICASLGPTDLLADVDMEAIWGDEAREYCPINLSSQ
jgi:hypothetical protein